MIPKAIVTVSRLVLVMGITIVAMSIMCPGGVDAVEYIEPGNSEGVFVLATQDMFLRVYTREGNYTFSLYVLDYEDILFFLENGNVSNTEPLMALENIEEYAGPVHFPSRGTYGIIVTHPHNESIGFFFHSLMIPNISVLTAGLVIATPMAVIQLAVQVRDRRYVEETRRLPPQ